MSLDQNNPARTEVRLGIDVGGTKIEGLAIDRLGRERGRRRIATPRDDYAATIAAIAELVASLEHLSGARGAVGLGIPGSLSPATGRVQNANSTWLNGRQLQGDLETALGRPVRIANDANCFAISEATDGAAAGAACVFGVILGTGCGAGIVLQGRLIDGPRGIGGEWGHNPLPWASADEHPGSQCWCGRLGCLETWISGPGLAADHVRHTGERIEAHDVATRAVAGDNAAQAALARHADRLARGLAHVVNLLDPDVIVLGGGLSQLEHLYRDVPPLMAKWIFADQTDIALRPPHWGDASGVRGAAWLWD